ncbi:MAG: bifunctional hydroxymethylpyrimidine kinase/phosphomethylpyrimidine kinase [Thermodesulfovibrionales bacterium]|nr:bifunctional hydroxymethylpyrimidine kinase/phosphomethylpyrimidine kinase [Thermodesulfovibrionales bacterium]
MKIALTIAGFDPTGGAGVQQDLKVFHFFGVYGLSVLSAITAQNTYEVRYISAVDKKSFEEQLFTLLSDIRPDALKTGMLFSKDIVKIITKVIKGYELQNLVVDPVTISTTGTMLIEEGTLDIMKKELFPLAKVITPNIYEASVLSGIRIESIDDMKSSAYELQKTGAEAVVITGGPFSGLRDEDDLGDESVDLLYDGKDFQLFRSKRVSGEYHGTGCAFSAAITGLLAKGFSVAYSVEIAKNFVTKAIKNAHTLGKGMRLLNIDVQR